MGVERDPISYEKMENYFDRLEITAMKWEMNCEPFTVVWDACKIPYFRLNIMHRSIDYSDYFID